MAGRYASSRHTHAGFSLLEMMITLLVLSISAAVAIPRWVDAADRRRLQCAASVIESDLRAALRSAAITSQTVTLTAMTNTGTLVISPALSSGSVPASTQIDYSLRFSGLKFTQANFDGATSCKIDIYQRWIHAQTGQPLAAATLEVQLGNKRVSINLLTLLRSSSASGSIQNVAFLPSAAPL